MPSTKTVWRTVYSNSINTYTENVRKILTGWSKKIASHDLIFISISVEKVQYLVYALALEGRI